MPDYIISTNVKNIDLQNLRMGIPRKKEDNSRNYYSVCKFKDLKDKGQKKDLYFLTPTGFAGSLQFGNSLAYFDLFLEEKNSEYFKDFINRLDIYIIQKIWENRVTWGFAEETPIMAIENRWVPTMKLSSLNFQRDCLKFEIPLKIYGNSKYLDLDLYDQANDELPHALLKPEYPTKALICLKGIVKTDGFFYLDLAVKQLKVKIPDQVFETCQLSDSEEEEEKPKLIWEFYEDLGLIEEVIEE